jgi:hypothetical protein
MEQESIEQKYRLQFIAMMQYIWGSNKFIGLSRQKKKTKNQNYSKPQYYTNIQEHLHFFTLDLP